MDEIRAFVGHSFDEEDADLVDKFLKYFDRLSRLHSTFSWQHAQAAEPRILAEKVMSLIANKDVFIGICTKRERVVEPSSLSTLVFQSSYYKAHQTDFQW